MKQESGASGPAPTRRHAVQALGAGTFCGMLRAQAARERRDTVQLDSEFQTIDNFGASDCWSMQKVGGWAEESRIRVADLLFSQTNGIGLSCWRFNIGGGINPRITNPWRTAETFEIDEARYDWSRQANERWFLAAARERGVPQFLAFVNSPPGRMTRNGFTFCGAEGTTNLKPGFEGQYARYLVDILQHFRANPDQSQRIAFDYLSPVNEPQWDWTGHSQEGNRASNSDIKAMVRAIHAELQRQKCPTQLAILESGCLPDMWRLNDRVSAKYQAPYGAYLKEFAGDASISSMLSGRIGFHDYGSDPIDGGLVEHRKTLGEHFKNYPGWRLWATEYCVMVGSGRKGGSGRDLMMNTALDVARIIHLDLTLAGTSAWHWWTAFSPVDYKDGLIYTDWKKPGDPESIYPARLLWTLGNYSRFVRPGMRRVGIAGPADDIHRLMVSAYKDDRARRVVAVYVNMGVEAERVHLAFSLGRRNWHLKSITPYVTSDHPGDELKRYPEMGTEAPVDIGPRSVVTLLAQF